MFLNILLNVKKTNKAAWEKILAKVCWLSHFVQADVSNA